MGYKKTADKNAFIEEHAKKDSLWLAKKLWDVKEERDKYRWRIERDYQEVRGQNMVRKERGVLLERNANLAGILEKNGIRPTRLRITYEVDDCGGCPGIDPEMCVGCEPEAKKCVGTFSFYDYHIADDELTGIREDFERDEFDVLLVEDERTGKILWKSEVGG